MLSVWHDPWGCYLSVAPNFALLHPPLSMAEHKRVAHTSAVHRRQNQGTSIQWSGWPTGILTIAKMVRG
jgi:hypothetical protein